MSEHNWQSESSIRATKKYVNDHLSMGHTSCPIDTALLHNILADLDKCKSLLRKCAVIIQDHVETCQELGKTLKALHCPVNINDGRETLTRIRAVPGVVEEK